MTQDPLELLSPARLASLLSVTVGALAMWRHAHCGPAWIKLGPHRASKIRYRRCDVEQWLNSHGTGWEARSQGDGSLPHPQQPPRLASDGPGRVAGLCVRRYARRKQA